MSRVINFDCTMCGRCCHDLRLPLSIDEAISWIDKDGVVELLCDAAPLDDGYGPSSGSYRDARSIRARSGTLEMGVAVTLTATFAGPCPFLETDMRCGNYADRPAVCRVYPAEANPFRYLDPATKACPADAWDESRPALLRDGRVIDPALHATIASTRDTVQRDVKAKAWLCAILGIDVAAFANEGLVVHAVERSALRAALQTVRNTSDEEPTARQWHIATNRRTTRAMLVDAGCSVAAMTGSLIPFFASEE